jgi:peroxiredoxin
LLKAGSKLPEVMLLNRYGQKVSSTTFTHKKTVIFFWTASAVSHLEGVHKKILEFQQNHPDYQFVGININDSAEECNKLLNKYKFNSIKEYRCADFEDIKAKWVITKIHRTIILDEKGLVKNAFTNVFELNFEEELK